MPAPQMWSNEVIADCLSLENPVKVYDSFSALYLEGWWGMGPQVLGSAVLSKQLVIAVESDSYTQGSKLGRSLTWMTLGKMHNFS